MSDKNKNGNSKSNIKKAVALQYLKSKEKLRSPKVIAKAKGQEARRMKRIAEEKGVPILKDENACELLMGVKKGKEIPPELYEVAAEIIAYVYLLNQKKEGDK